MREIVRVESGDLAGSADDVGNRRGGQGVGGGSGQSHAVSADLILLSAFTLWALNFSVVKFGLSEFQPLSFASIRFGLSGLVLLVLLRVREGSIGIRRQDMPAIALVSVLGVTLTQVFFMFALANTGASDMALLTATGPLVTGVLATALGVERFGPRHWTAVGVGLIGVLLIVGGEGARQIGNRGILGDLLALGNVATSSGSTIPIMSLMRRYSAHRILTYQMLIGTAILLPFAVPSLLTADYRSVSLAAWASLAYAAVFAAIATNLLYFTAIGRIGPSRSSMYQYLQLFLGVLFAVVLLHETVTALQLAGGLVVIASLMLARRRARDRAGATWV